MPPGNQTANTSTRPCWRSTTEPTRRTVEAEPTAAAVNKLCDFCERRQVRPHGRAGHSQPLSHHSPEPLRIASVVFAYVLRYAKSGLGMRSGDARSSYGLGRQAPGARARQLSPTPDQS